jgi:hypothetical protein
MDNIFLDRTFSSFPLSIGTGLALESLFENTIDKYDKDRVIPNKLKVDDYKFHVFSVYTLARNIISATNVKNRDLIIYNKTFIEAVLEEISVIAGLYNGTKCKPLIYMPDYLKVTQVLNTGKGPGNGKLYDEISKLRTVLKLLPKLSVLPVITDFKLVPTEGKVLITTSMVTDLLNIKNVKQLALLESHTGKLKEKIDWNTKYHSIGAKPLDLFPFMEELLYILGDNTITKPLKLSTRIELFNIAHDNNWTGKTTRDKVIYDTSKSSLLKELIAGYRKLF